MPTKSAQMPPLKARKPAMAKFANHVSRAKAAAVVDVGATATTARRARPRVKQVPTAPTTQTRVATPLLRWPIP